MMHVWTIKTAAVVVVVVIIIVVVGLDHTQFMHVKKKSNKIK